MLNLVNVLEKGVALHLKKSKVSSIKDLPILAEISSVILVKILINFVNVFSPFPDYLPLENGVILELNPNPICQVWLKLAHWFWRKAF